MNSISYHLRECVNYSSHVLVWCAEKAGDHDIDIVLIKLWKNAFQLLDGIAILLENGCVRPTEPLFIEIKIYFYNVLT
jgi:hypothetical protein